MDTLDQLQAKLDKILNPSMPEPVAIPEVKAEPINPVYYQIAAGMGNNDGAASMSPEEKDLRTLNPNQLIAKYGEENANYMLGNLARASAELQRNNLAERNWGETAWDSTTGVANAFVGGLGGIAAYGAGKVNAEAGVGLSDVVESLRRYTEENQSDALNARRRVGAAKDSLSQRDSDAQYDLDIKNGDSELVAGLAQFTRDVVNSSVFKDRTLLAQGTADAIGSFATAYPVVGAIKGVAKLLVPKATVRGIGLSGAMDAELGKWTVNRALSHADKLVWPGAIGTLESGGTYQQTVEDAINTLKQQGKTVGDKIEQINDTGQQAADRMFLPAAGLGTITRFGEKPFHVPSLRQGATNILGREAPEEAGQGALGTILSNQAIQDKIDPNRKTGQGVADATVQGAVYGSFAAGAVQGPGIAKQSVISAAKATLGYVDKRTALAAEKADDASPVGTKALKEKASTLVPNAEPVKQTLAAELSGTDLTPEEKDQGIKYANDLVDSLKVSVENEFDDTIPPELSAIISGSEHRIDAIQQLGKKVITTSDPNEKLLTAATMYQLLQPILDLQTNRPSSVDSLSPESQAVLKDYESLIANVNNSPTIKNAMKQIHEIMVAQGATVISPVMEEELNTPAGKQKVQSIITAANIAPDQGNLDANESILKHAKEGKLNLTPEQTTTLNASTALLRARKELEEKNKQFGLNAADIVSSEILTDRGVKDNNARSATQYTQEILSAVRRGNTLGAAQLLNDMGLFVQHMKNKVEAINKHYLSGDTSKGSYVAYDALLPTTHQWVRSDTNPKAIHKGGFVNISSPDSIKFVQGVELEHKILADVYNSLTEVFPDLGIDRIEPLQLEKGISGAVRITTQEPTKPVVKEEPKPTNKSINDLNSDDWSTIIGSIQGKVNTDGANDSISLDDVILLKKLVIKIITDGVNKSQSRESIISRIEQTTKGGISNTAMQRIHALLDNNLKEKPEVKVVEPKVEDKPIANKREVHLGLQTRKQELIDLADLNKQDVSESKYADEWQALEALTSPILSDENILDRSDSIVRLASQRNDPAITQFANEILKEAHARVTKDQEKKAAAGQHTSFRKVDDPKRAEHQAKLDERRIFAEESMKKGLQSIDKLEELLQGKKPVSPASTPPVEAEIKTTPATWSNQDTDLPVDVFVDDNGTPISENGYTKVRYTAPDGKVTINYLPTTEITLDSDNDKRIKQLQDKASKSTLEELERIFKAVQVKITNKDSTTRTKEISDVYGSEITKRVAEMKEKDFMIKYTALRGSVAKGNTEDSPLLAIYNKHFQKNLKEGTAAKANEEETKVQEKPVVAGTPTPSQDTPEYTWGRYPNGKPNLEVSSHGNAFSKQFSAFIAKLSDGRTIEEAYQLDVKGYRVQGNDWRLGKGKPSINGKTPEELWIAYKDLWKQFFKENPALFAEMKVEAKGKILTDKFAKSAVSQARAIAELLNEDPSVTTPKETAPVQSVVPPYYTGKITPDKNTVFVFGSNPEGRHGAGAALIAKNQFGAKYGQGEGLQGNAYALPTKDLRVTKDKGLRSIPGTQITESIKKLYVVAKQHPDKLFKIAFTNTTEASLNGYTGLEMIEMFNAAGVAPTNIIFSEEWFKTGKLLSTKVTPKQTAPVVEAKSEPVTFTGKMTFAYGSNKRSDVESDTTFDAIKAGERTATTRYTTDGKIDYWSKAKVGDIIEFSNKDGDIVRVEVTKPLTKLPSNTDGETWSKKEGWSVDYFNKNVKPKLDKAYQLEYKLIGKAEPKKTKTPEPTPPVEEIVTPPKAFELNEGQKNAFTKIMEFINDSRQTFSLVGPAGTGKTTIVNTIVAALKKAGSIYGEVILTSPTHRANTVTRSKNPNETVVTLHKLLSLSPSIDLDNLTAEDVKFAQRSMPEDKDPFPRKGLIIVDESSMMNKELYNFLMVKLAQYPEVKILFLGDLKQLRPIVKDTKDKDGNTIKAVSTDSPALLDTENQVVLTKVERAKNPELLDESTHVREKGRFTKNNQMKESNGVGFSTNIDEFTNVLVSMFKSKDFLNNRLLVRAVAYTNNRVKEINKTVRTALFGSKAADYIPGDLIMGYKTHLDKEDPLSMLVANGVDYLVLDVGEIRTEVQKGTNKYGMNLPDVSLLVQDLTIKDIYGVDGVSTVTVVLPSNTEETWAALGQIYNELSKLPRKNPHMKEEVASFYNSAINRFVLPQDVTIPSVDWNGKPYLDQKGKPKTKSVAKRSIDYGYAHTIHKSQGGTYTYVFVDDTTIGFPADADTQTRLRYVGMTRAEKGAFILVNGKTTGEEPTLADFIESDERITEAELESQYEEEVPVEIPDIDTVTSWARYPTAGVPNIEVSTKGDAFGKQFSALNATLNDGRTIEEAYQVGIKGHASIAAGKGKPPLNSLTKEETWQAYKNLWRDFFDENPELYEELKEKARGKVLTDQFASTFVSQARAISEILNEHYILNIPKNPKKTETPTVEPTNKVDPKTFTNHSGGAYGADTMWDTVGREFGVTKHNHYRDEGNSNLSKKLKDAGVKAVTLTAAALNKARDTVNKLLGTNHKDDIAGNLQARNYYQVANSDGVFAIGSLTSNKKGVTGGTNTAIQLAIKLTDKVRPVYVWDTNTQRWYEFNRAKGLFQATTTPTLTKEFAGIGTRDIENYNTKNQLTGKFEPRKQYVGDEIANAAKQAIKDVYAKTLLDTTPVNEELDNELPIEDNFDDYFNDESPIVTGNKNAVITVKPDVVVPSKLKKLVQGIQNFFIQSFKFKGKETTRTDSVGSPLEFVKDALLDNSLFQEAVPNSKYSLNKDVIKAYRSYLGQYYDNLSNTLAKNLQDFLTVPNKKGVVRLNRINKGDPLHRYAEGKVLNLTEKVGDTYKYNQHLLELATLAGLQWFLTAGQTERRLEPREIAKLTGIPEGKLSNSLIDSILNTSDTGQLSQGLTNTIKSFWGVSGINTEMMAYTDGIAEAMAAEILRAFEELGMITKTSIYIDKATNQQLIPDPNYYLTLQNQENDEETAKTLKTIIRLEVNRFDNDVLYSFPTAIQEVVLIESEDVTYFGDDIPPVPQTQLGDTTIKLSRKEKKAIAAANKTEVKTNVLQANVIMSLSQDALKVMFGGGIENENMNKNTLAAIQGKNKTVLNAYQAMVDMLSKVDNVSKTLGKDAGEVVMRFPHTITAVGRLMMLGKYNIQSSKLLREVFLPTWSTLDLQNNQDHIDAFHLAVSQALGIKVHNEGPESINKLRVLLSGKLAPAITLVQEWMEATDNGENPIEFDGIKLAQIFKDAKEGLTPNAFHALVEYVRYQRTEDKTKFTTGLYLEADGVTNGPGNAIEMLTLGQFTAEWVTTVEKIGHSFAEPKAKHELDKNNPDLYKTGGINSVKHSQAVITKIKQSPDKEEIMQILGSLYSLLSMNVKGITYDPSKLEETGGVLANRDFFKNPLTILVYGSGIPGLAGKAAKQMADNIYKRFSDANILLNSKEGKNLTVAQAMFPGDENAEQTYKKFVEDLNRIRRTTIDTEYVDRKKVYVVYDVTQPEHKYDKSELQKFTFSDSEIDAITQNITKGLVEAMYEGAVETVGRTVMQSSKMIQQATQIQSILLEAAFTKAIQDKIASHAATAKDTGYINGDFISKQDFMDIMEELKVIAPYLKTPDQTFLAAKSGRYRNEKNKSIGYSLSLNSKYRTDPNMYIPTNAGVSGTPNLVIGMGDAYAILQAAIDESLVGNLWIYDGINMPLDKILDYAPKLNKAAFEAWQNNPLRVIEESFRSFMGEKSMMIKALNETLNNEDLADQLNKSLRLYKTNDKLSSGNSDYALSIFGDLLNDLKNSADSIDARHAAIARMPNSVDQLAAAGVSWHNGITVDPTLDTPEKIAEQLNKYYQEELDKIKNKPKAEPVKKMTPEEMDPITKDMLSNTVTDELSGVKILHAAGLFNLGKSINLSREQRKAYIQLVRSNKLEGYKVVFGSIEQIKKYRELYGYKFVDLDQETDNGFIDMNNKIIHLINPSVETLVHEMIHSATYGSVLNYYQNPSLNTKEVNDAIERTEKLLNEFLKLSPKELARLTPEQRVAINNVKAAIEEPGTNFDNSTAEVQAKALNEFMAWSLSNQDLISAFKNVKLPTALRIAQEVIAIIKKFFTFKDKATGEIKEQDLQVPEDLFGNLLFNASIIINSAQPSLAETMVETTLFHSGTAKHITQLRETLIDKVALFLDKSGQAFNVALYNTGLGRVLTEAGDTVNSLVPIFGLSAIERSTLHHVVAALSAQIQVDPLTIDGIQTLYAHTVVELAKQVDAGTYPKVKYDALIGRIGNPKIINGKSTLLPVFLGLGLIDTELRDALAKIDMPTKTKNTTGTLNGGLENQANKMLDGLFKVLTGQRKAHDVSDALELLTERLTEIALKEDSAAKSVFNKPGINTDKANEWITDKIAVVADKGIALGKKLETSQYLAVKRLGSAITVLSMMATDKNGETVARGAIAMANKGNVWKPFRSLLTDFVGRSDSNAETYDLIKKVRAAVQQMRQTFRDKVPKIIAQKFTRPLDKKEWAILFRSMAKTDLSSLMDILSKKEIMEIFSNPSSINKHISMLETRIQNQDSVNWPLYQAKMKQLAKYMNTGVTGSNLLRNPYAIHRLLNMPKPKKFQTMGVDAIHSIDQLTTLYAIQSLSQEDKSFMSDMVNEQSEGLEFIIDYLVGQNVTEITKLSISPTVKMNYYKGHIPQINQSGASLIVAEDVNRADLLLQGYTRVGDYLGSNIDPDRVSKGYYFTDVSAKGAVSQGTIQNIQRTILGVDDFYGFTIGSNDRITDPLKVEYITKYISRENVSNENLLPVFDAKGAVIAYERTRTPEKLALLKPSEHLAEMIGVWRGRQLEEQLAQEINEEVLDKHYEMYRKDIANSPSSQKEYVNILDPKQLDITEQDMVSLFSFETHQYIANNYGDKFYVRKDVLDDMIGYRKASVSDIFTGKTRMNKPLQDAIRKVLIAAFGANAYRKAVKTERFLQNVVGEARTLIVVKSLVVPMFNIVSNIVQLVARGVPLATIVKSTPTKLLELRSYTMSQVKQVELEAEHRAASGDLRKQQVLDSQIQAIKDGHKRLSIWPLIEAGEFSTISDIGNNSEDIDLFSGNTESWLDNKISKLPANAQTAVRYGMVTRDTALFQGLQKMVQYGDFIAKAVMYDDLMKRKGLTKEQALGKITDEFVNYDKLPGRARGYLEDTGLLWFYNYKLRITKIALSMMRNNPLHLLLAHAMPIPLGAGIATEDNFITKLLDGSLTRSIGPGMVVGAPLLNPWYNAVN